MTLDIEALREFFPNPMAASPTLPGYCVGASVGKVLNLAAVDFPSPNILGYTLRHANQRLTVEKSLEFAHEVIYCNDRSSFEAAWAILDEALKWNEVSE